MIDSDATICDTFARSASAGTVIGLDDAEVSSPPSASLFSVFRMDLTSILLTIVLAGAVATSVLAVIAYALYQAGKRDKHRPRARRRRDRKHRQKRAGKPVVSGEAATSKTRSTKEGGASPPSVWREERRAGEPADNEGSPAVHPQSQSPGLRDPKSDSPEPHDPKSRLSGTRDPQSLFWEYTPDGFLPVDPDAPWLDEKEGDDSGDWR